MCLCFRYNYVACVVSVKYDQGNELCYLAVKDSCCLRVAESPGVCGAHEDGGCLRLQMPFPGCLDNSEERRVAGVQSAMMQRDCWTVAVHLALVEGTLDCLLQVMLRTRTPFLIPA